MYQVKGRRKPVVAWSRLSIKVEGCLQTVRGEGSGSLCECGLDGGVCCCGQEHNENLTQIYCELLLILSRGTTINNQNKSLNKLGCGRAASVVTAGSNGLTAKEGESLLCEKWEME